jgi:3-dehydroquinate dehydratase
LRHLKEKDFIRINRNYNAFEIRLDSYFTTLKPWDSEINFLISTCNFFLKIPIIFTFRSVSHGGCLKLDYQRDSVELFSIYKWLANQYFNHYFDIELQLFDKICFKPEKRFPLIILSQHFPAGKANFANSKESIKSCL